MMRCCLVIGSAELLCVLCGSRMDHLTVDRLEDQHAEERDEDRVLLGGEKPRHDELVPETEDVGDGRGREQPERAGIRAGSRDHRREYDEAIPFGQVTSVAPANAARSSTALSMARRVDRSPGASCSSRKVITSSRPRSRSAL